MQRYARWSGFGSQGLISRASGLCFDATLSAQMIVFERMTFWRFGGAFAKQLCSTANCQIFA